MVGARLVGIAAVLLSSCTMQATPEELLAETAANLRDLRSGDLSLRVTTEVEDDPEAVVGFELTGPFELSPGLPTAELTYTSLAGADSSTVRFLSDGERAIIEGPEGVSEVTSQDLGVDAGAAATVTQLPIGDWFEDPAIAGRDAGLVHITSDLDVAAAFVDVFAAARGAGATSVAGLPVLDEATARRLDAMVRSAKVDVWTGADDRMLRRLELDVLFGANVPAELQEALAGLDGVRFRFELRIDRVNEAVAPPVLP